jgi:hypothetical protein
MGIAVRFNPYEPLAPVEPDVAKVRSDALDRLTEGPVGETLRISLVESIDSVTLIVR